MTTKISLCFLIFVFNFSFSSAQWISFDESSPPDSKPEIKLLSDNASSTVIKIDLPGCRINEFSAGGKNYHSISIHGESAVTTETGLPEIQHIARVLAIPNKGTVSIEVLETGSPQIIGGINLPPVRESWLEGKPETPYIEDNDYYSSENLYPQVLARVEEPMVFRDFRITRVSIFPIRYSPAKKEIETYSSITVRINYGPGLGINPKLTPKKPIAPSFAKLYKSFLFNYDEVLEREYSSNETGYDIMLCIMPDMFVSSFQQYADWKHKSGTYIHITKFSEIGASANNPTAVRDHILDTYNNWENPPTHVLIVGDDGVAPVKYITYDYTFVNEDYFVELEGNDYFPEMLIGRFTNQGDYRMRVMINKYMGYERNPYTADTEWFKKGIVCSNNAYASQIDTKRFTRLEMVDRGGFTHVDTFYNDYPCPGNVNDIKNIINEGRSYLNYRGEGWSSGWWASCFPFGTYDVSSLNNGEKLTFVTSIGCGVAMFDANGGNCFGEEWVQLGSLEDPRGACAFVGPTSNSHTACNNRLDKGLYIGMFRENMDSPGEALLRGRFQMYYDFGNTHWVEYHFRVYCVLGDPSLHIWKDIPRTVTVTHPDTVYTGFSQVQVNVTDSSIGLPIGDAQVCISNDDVYVVGRTSLSGSVILDVNAPLEGELSIVVRGGNVNPYEGTIQIVTGTENVAPEDDPVVTDLDGNNDGLINPNENCTITFTLKNFGNQAANNVYASLHLPDSVDLVEIITSDSISYGDLSPNESATGTPFQFFVKPECPVGYTIPFELHVSSATSYWLYHQNEFVHGCQLEYAEYFVDDEGNVLRNFRMDPGETVNVVFKINNSGDDIAPDVKGILSSNDEYITILDSVGTFGSIPIDSSALNETDYFKVKVSENCPLQYEAAYSITLLTQNGLYPYSSFDALTIPVAMPSGPDPTGPDSYGYYAYSSDDNLWDQSPQYNWIEISGIGTEIPKPPGVSDFTETVGLPFTFRYYGIDFAQARISSDGWIAFGSGSQTAPENFPLPRQDDINNMAAAFWDDLFSNEPGEEGKLFYYSDVANHRFIIEWYEVRHALNTADKETFQVILFDPAHYPTQTGDGEIICQYKKVTDVSSCTIGIENNTEEIGLQYVFNELYDVTATELVDNFAIKFTTDSSTVVSVGDEEQSEGQLPVEYALEQNYPNPFNPETRIRYSIPEQGYVTLKIYRIDGQLVKTLQDGYQSAGVYETVWDGKNISGSKVSSGVYFYKLESNNFSRVRKMILLK